MTYYRGASIRTQESQRYKPVIYECDLSTRQLDDGEGWVWINDHGSQGGPYDTQEEAIEALRETLERQGWTQSRGDAEEEAFAVASRRAGDTCKQLRKLINKHKTQTHIKLTGIRGDSSRAQVYRWSMGIEPIPDDIAKRIESM